MGGDVEDGDCVPVGYGDVGSGFVGGEGDGGWLKASGGFFCFSGGEVDEADGAFGSYATVIDFNLSSGRRGGLLFV